MGKYNPRFPSGSCLIMWVLKSREPLLSGVRGRCDCGQMVREMATLLALKMEERAVSQGMWVDSRRWKRQQNRFSPRAFRKDYSPADTMTLGRDQSRTSNLQNSKSPGPMGSHAPL